MSSRECIWVAYPVEVDKYLEVLQQEFGARPHPHEPNSYLVGNPSLPFYAPQLIDGQMAITGFNYVPLSLELVWALCLHPELAPPKAMVRWTHEQWLVTRGNLARMKRLLRDREPRS